MWHIVAIDAIFEILRVDDKCWISILRFLSNQWREVHERRKIGGNNKLRLENKKK